MMAQRPSGHRRMRCGASPSGTRRSEPCSPSTRAAGSSPLKCAPSPRSSLPNSTSREACSAKPTDRCLLGCPNPLRNAPGVVRLTDVGVARLRFLSAVREVEADKDLDERWSPAFWPPTNAVRGFPGTQQWCRCVSHPARLVAAHGLRLSSCPLAFTPILRWPWRQLVPIGSNHLSAFTAWPELTNWPSGTHKRTKLEHGCTETSSGPGISANAERVGAEPE